MHPGRLAGSPMILRLRGKQVSKRELERYLAGGDIQHTFVVVFKTADIGITWVMEPMVVSFLAHYFFATRMRESDFRL